MSTTRRPGWGDFKTAAEDSKANATKYKNAGRVTRQDHAQHTDKRDSKYAVRSHKCIPTERALPGSPQRTDSRFEMYRWLAASAGQDHE